MIYNAELKFYFEICTYVLNARICNNIETRTCDINTAGFDQTYLIMILSADFDLAFMIWQTNYKTVISQCCSQKYIPVDAIWQPHLDTDNAERINQIMIHAELILFKRSIYLYAKPSETNNSHDLNHRKKLPGSVI